MDPLYADSGAGRCDPGAAVVGDLFLSAYLVRAGAAARNPFGDGMQRPAAPRSSATRGLSEDELQRLLAYAAVRETPRTFALLAVMVSTGCRVSSVTGTTTGSIGRDRGHAVIDLAVKGGHRKRFVLPPLATDAVDRYLATRTGYPIDQPYVFRLCAGWPAPLACPIPTGCPRTRCGTRSPPCCKWAELRRAHHSADRVNALYLHRSVGAIGPARPVTGGGTSLTSAVITPTASVITLMHPMSMRSVTL